MPVQENTLQHYVQTECSYWSTKGQQHANGAHTESTVIKCTENTNSWEAVWKFGISETNVHHLLLTMILKKKIPRKEQSDGQNTKHTQKLINKFYLLCLSLTKHVNLRNKELLARDTTVQV